MPNFKPKGIGLCLLALFLAALPTATAEDDAPEEAPRRRSLLSLDFDTTDLPMSRRWSFKVGAARITPKSIAKIMQGDIKFSGGDEGGWLYIASASYLIGEFQLGVGDMVFRPKLEAPLTLEVFDEHARRPFLSYNAALMVRWVDFPWNNYVRTTAGLGWGLSYSEKIPAMERRKRPEQHRSHLKFTLPVEVTFAHPRWPQHQLAVFIAHQSGGFGFFDHGGLNSVGLGYRLSFW